MRNTIFGLLLIAATVNAEPSQWLRKNNSDVLSMSVVSGDDCPISTKSLTKIVEGVLVRSRIKPIDLWLTIPDPLALNVYLECMKVKGNNPAFHTSVRFAKLSDGPNDELLVTTQFMDYGALGIGDKEFITQSIKNSVENAITDYLRSNFDLNQESE